MVRLQLCLSCSSSPTPKDSNAPFMTSCCSRPICAACLERTPRLRDYSPCLACLAGVSAVSKTNTGAQSTPQTAQRHREESMFVLGDSDEEEGDPSPPPYDRDDTHVESGQTAKVPPDHVAPAPSTSSGPPTYHVRVGDTLQGIALRFGVDGRELCTLNKLPYSTLSTTPHVLHTRRTLTLPLNARNLGALPPPPTEEEQAQRQRERAEKRFQFVTKEVDWRVARTYVALAEDDDLDPGVDFAREDKKSLTRVAPEPLESRAVDQYLDDEEWDRAQGSKVPSIPRFPVKA